VQPQRRAFQGDFECGQFVLIAYQSIGHGQRQGIESARSGDAKVSPAIAAVVLHGGLQTRR
jgi:hypothetical protein